MLAFLWGVAWGAGAFFCLRAASGPGVRFDTMLFPGCTVPAYYDSLLGKLIVHDTDRAGALARMRRALDSRSSDVPPPAATARIARPPPAGPVCSGSSQPCGRRQAECGTASSARWPPGASVEKGSWRWARRPPNIGLHLD